MLDVLMEKFGHVMRSNRVQIVLERATELATRMTSVKLSVCEASSQLKRLLWPMPAAVFASCECSFSHNIDTLAGHFRLVTKLRHGK